MLGSSAPNVVPEPPWQSTTAAWARTSRCATHFSARTFDGRVRSIAASPSRPRVTRTRTGSPSTAARTAR